MIIFKIIITLLVCVILTILIEYIPIVCFLHISKKYFIVTNVLTNVLANVAVMIFDIVSKGGHFIIDRTQFIIIIEILVVLTEIILYNIYLNKKGMTGKKYLFKNIALTIVANIMSFLLGTTILKILMI